MDQRLTLAEAAAAWLKTAKVGDKTVIDLHLDDRLTGRPDGYRPRGNSTIYVDIEAVVQKNGQGRKRLAAVMHKDEVLAAGWWD
jgi:hypothetical protein